MESPPTRQHFLSGAEMATAYRDVYEPDTGCIEEVRSWRADAPQIDDSNNNPEPIERTFEEQAAPSGRATDWSSRAKCKGYDPDVFHPYDGAGVIAAKEICRECAVRTECLEYALEHKIDHGVWGGTSERQRKRILKLRRTLGSHAIANG